MTFRALRRLWKRLRGRCLYCGRKREAHPNCMHCVKDLYHWCGKREAFSKLAAFRVR